MPRASNSPMAARMAAQIALERLAARLQAMAVQSTLTVWWPTVLQAPNGLLAARLREVLALTTLAAGLQTGQAASRVIVLRAPS